jgi:hypothetical protein
MPTHPAGIDQSKTVVWTSSVLNLQLDVTIDRGEEHPEKCPGLEFKKELRPGMLGEGVVASIHLVEGQAISFVIREDTHNHITRNITTEEVDIQQYNTQSYWFNWISKSTYKGRWREVVNRSFMILKLLTFEPTGAIVAAPTFSIPEHIGGGRYVKFETHALTHLLTIVIAIGTIDFVGSGIQVLSFTSFFGWASSTRQIHSWSSSVSDSESQDLKRVHCP